MEMALAHKFPTWWHPTGGHRRAKGAQTQAWHRVHGLSTKLSKSPKRRHSVPAFHAVIPPTRFPSWTPLSYPSQPTPRHCVSLSLQLMLDIPSTFGHISHNPVCQANTLPGDLPAPLPVSIQDDPLTKTAIARYIFVHIRPVCPYYTQGAALRRRNPPFLDASLSTCAIFPRLILAVNS